jgi:hypothetical protein
MRSWGNRPDTAVVDEPFYAFYLMRTGLDHPGAREIIEHHETDWRAVVERLTGPPPDGRAVFYQKHMAHHLLPEIELGWLDRVRNCFLIRCPGEMLLSLSRVLPRPTVEQTGLPQQVRLFRRTWERTGAVPLVIDARDVLEDPPRLLRALCEAVQVPFSEAMLRWPPGPRATDGVWAKHWYAAVERSTGFAPSVKRTDPLPEHLREVLEACEPLYGTLWDQRLVAAPESA